MLVVRMNRNDKNSSKAIKALGELGDLAVNPLIAALVSQRFELAIKEEVVRALGKLKDVRAVDPLMHVLKNRIVDASIVTNALSSIGGLGTDVLISILKTKALLSDGRWAATKTLADARESRAFDAFLIALNDDDKKVRDEAVRGLGKLKDNRAVGPLMYALENGPPVDASITTNALASLGDAGIEALISILGYKGSVCWDQSRWAAAKALGESKESRAFDVLVAALDDYDQKVRDEAAHALGKLEDNRAVAPLTLALRDERLKFTAAMALGKLKYAGIPIGEEGEQAVKDRMAKIEQEQRAALMKHEQLLKEVEQSELSLKDRIQNLIHGLKSETLRENSRRELVKIGSQAVEKLIEFFSSKNESSISRESAGTALGQIGDKRAIDAFIRALLDENEFWYIRSRSAWGLGEIGDKYAVDPLAFALFALRTDEIGLGAQYKIKHFSEIRRSIIGALGKIRDDKAVKTLVRALDDKDSMIAAFAKIALKDS